MTEETGTEPQWLSALFNFTKHFDDNRIIFKRNH